MSALVPTVTGAPGDGSAALTAAIQRELQSKGIALASRPVASAYRVEGAVTLGSHARASRRSRSSGSSRIRRARSSARSRRRTTSPKARSTAPGAGPPTRPPAPPCRASSSCCRSRARPSTDAPSRELGSRVPQAGHLPQRTYVPSHYRVYSPLRSARLQPSGAAC